MEDLAHPIWDADNHYYEALDAFTSQMGTAVVAYQRTGRIALPRITP